MCTQEIRAISYDAEISGIVGTYDLAVVHVQDSTRDTVLAQRVVIPR